MGKLINLDEYRENKESLATRQNMKSSLDTNELMNVFKDLFPNGILENQNNENEYIGMNLKDLLEIDEDDSDLDEEEVELVEQAIDFYISFNKELTNRDHEVIRNIKTKHDSKFGDIYDTSNWGLR